MNRVSALHNWSGGLLCSYGLYIAQKQANILCLVNFRMTNETKQMSERLPTHILRLIADSLDLPLFIPSANSETIKRDMQALLTLVNQKYGVHSVVLNDFEQDGIMNVLKKDYEDSSFQVQNFIQNSDPEKLFSEALNLGFKAHILSVNDKSLNRSYLGAPLTVEMIKTFKENNIHPFGANGEFETICLDGPNFKHKIPLNFGDIHFKNSFWYREIHAG